MVGHRFPSGDSGDHSGVTSHQEARRILSANASDGTHYVEHRKGRKHGHLRNLLGFFYRLHAPASPEEKNAGTRSPSDDRPDRAQTGVTRHLTGPPAGDHESPGLSRAAVY